ncbi:MAG: hypothetical protein QNJ98_14475 [Planctomycetota bacterium]|nr:hypothetical protein [Planctomycetota bacterium]
MTSVRSGLLALLLVCAFAAPAAAGPESDAGTARTPIPQVGEIPARTIEVEREVFFPAVVQRICTPIYETIEVPVEERRVTPKFEEQEVPVYAWRLVPVYRTVETPIHGTELEPLYVPVKRRVSLPVCAPFSCGCKQIPLYEKCAKVQVAWLEKETVEGYRKDSLPRGMRRERYVARHETKRVRVGEDVEVVQVGTRTERRLKGYSTEVIELSPARTEVVKETITIPARRVTVAPEGTACKPLPGTFEVLTPDELAALSAGS